VGVAIYFLVRQEGAKGCTIYYTSVADYAPAEAKKAYLRTNRFRNLPFVHIRPDKTHNWINLADNAEWKTLVPMGTKKTDPSTIFKTCAPGVNTARDEWVLEHSRAELHPKVQFFIERFNQQVITGPDITPTELNALLDYSIKWSATLKQKLRQGVRLSFDETLITTFNYRPFVKQWYYADKEVSDRLTTHHFEMFGADLSLDNSVIVCSGVNTLKPFTVLAVNRLPDLHFNGDSQCFPFYRYEANGTRVDNITDWALAQFQDQYADTTITRLDIFHYVYAVLHDPVYRTQYALNLKREFPRLPLYADFGQWAAWGQRLLALHLHYETAAPYPLQRVDVAAEGTPKPLLKADKTAGLIVLDTVTTLRGVPASAWDYRLGNRAALEWVLEYHKERPPKDPTIRERFNTYRFAAHKEPVIALLQRVCTVSVETMNIIAEMRRDCAAPVSAV